MKKRWLLLTSLVVILLLLGGIGYYLFVAKVHAPTVGEGSREEKTSIFTTIQEALSKSLSLQCQFTDEQNRSITAYLKAGAVRADIVGKDEKQPYNNSSVIMKDKKLYVWDTTTKKGIVMAITDEQMKLPTRAVSPTPSVTGASSQSAGNMLSMLEKYKNSCKTAVIADSLFVAPTDVVFTDVSQMMPSNVPSNIPTGTMNEEQIKQMMQQYQPSSQ